MNYAEKLLNHAGSLLAKQDEWQEANLRRAVSASYYALFHQINEDAATLIAPNVSTDTNYRIQRWFEHAEMKKICGRFLSPKLEQPLLGLVGPTASPDLQFVCDKFIALQNRRHDADYNLTYAIDYHDALIYVSTAADSIAAWKRLRQTEEANVFVLSLLMWDNWKKDRK